LGYNAPDLQGISEAMQDSEVARCGHTFHVIW
jgi:hypothetical protein